MRQGNGWMVLLVLLGIGVSGQKLPTRDEGLFQMQIRDKTLFHDSSVIPDGAEISGYLFRDTPKRYYFVVEEDNTPLSVTVTPCDAPLEWRLSLQELKEEGSAEGSGNTPYYPTTRPGYPQTMVPYHQTTVPYHQTMVPSDH
ncbi:protein NDNF-like, partial [Pseudochaenichthys georgianus]|uniref:protein NDNF-like n=1 Tax=Pseudochaenichthys georgianus TaxID=52239 RepID=UPI00146D6425